MTNATATLPAANPAEIVRYAVEAYFPNIALVTAFAPEDFELIDLLVRVNPDVKIFWLKGSVPRDAAKAGIERIKSKHSVTPLRAESLAELTREWTITTVLTAARSASTFQTVDGLLLVNPFAKPTRRRDAGGVRG
jgi:hypothetical protein